jgi:hypothetical protein
MSDLPRQRNKVCAHLLVNYSESEPENQKNHGSTTPGTYLLPTACRYCGSEDLEIGDGAGPHAVRVDCADCKRFQKWISKAAAAQLGLGGTS